ncbi:MAG TPA: serine/threonine protein kinase [Pyrinomonadaceae bacterium]|nr:serine/threonine protein kinase [Pyrinomonadaceae bacterium]
MTMRNSATETNVEFNPFLDLQGCFLESKIKILRQIARGSYAEIFQGSIQTDTGDVQTVAIKALNLNLQGQLDPDLEKTLTDNICFEADVLRQIEHPNVPRYFSSGWSRDNRGNDFYYIVQELVEGEILARLCRHQPLSVEKVLLFTGQLCETLGYIHQLKIIHRDIKPNNIIVSPDNSTVKLIDFGTSRHLDRSGDLITQVGTETYSAPEHLSMTENSILSPAADVYALAKNVYFMLTGSAPTAFRQKPITAFPVQHNSENFSQPILEVLNQATNNLPENRYQSAAAFMKHLTEAFEATTVRTRHSAQREIREDGFVVNVPDYEPPISKFSRLAGSTIRRTGRAIKTSGLWTINFSRKLFYFTSPKIVSVFRLIKNGFVRIPFNQFPLKKFGKILLAIALTVLIVIAGYEISSQWNFIKNLLNPTKNNNQNNDGSHFTAVTDINLRANPSGKSLKVGLVPKDSVVKIVSINKSGNWCEVIVQQYAREKEDPSSSDRGWVNKSNLVPKQ